MRKTPLIMICILLSAPLFAQPAAEKATLLPVLLNEYTYDESNDVLIKNDEAFKVQQFDAIAFGSNQCVVIWIQSADDYSRFNEVRIARYRYSKSKKSFEKVDEEIFRNQVTNTVEASTIELSPGNTAIAVTSGYDSDGDGDEVVYNLFAVIEGKLTNLLEHTLRSSSGDGCDGESMESTIMPSEILNSGFPDLIVEESSSTFSHCDENNEESCTKISRWTYSWNGKSYSRN